MAVCVGNPFLWRERYEAGRPSIFGEDFHFCSLEYRAWQGMTDKSKRLRPWPKYRDQVKYKPRRQREAEAA